MCDWSSDVCSSDLYGVIISQRYGGDTERRIVMLKPESVLRASRQESQTKGKKCEATYHGSIFGRRPHPPPHNGGGKAGKAFGYAMIIRLRLAAGR